MKSAAALIERLERDHARMATDIADLRALAMPDTAVDPDGIVDWIETTEAAKIAGLSVSRMTTLCGENRIERPGGFARKFGQWKISAGRLRAWLRQRDADRASLRR